MTVFFFAKRLNSLSTDNLRGSVVGRAAAGSEEVSIGHDVRETEISNLDIVVLIEKEIFRLQISETLYYEPGEGNFKVQDTTRA